MSFHKPEGSSFTCPLHPIPEGNIAVGLGNRSCGDDNKNFVSDHQGERFDSLPISSLLGIGIDSGIEGVLCGDRPRLGSVCQGSQDSLTLYTEHWHQLQLQMEESLRRGAPYSGDYGHEGIIFQEGLVPARGCYRESQQWSIAASLGSGTSGKCYVASDIKTEFVFAVKQIPLGKFIAEELEHWATLCHPNINPCYGAVREGDTIYILMQLVIGRTVEDVLSDGQGKLAEHQAMYYLYQLLEALCCLQRSRLVHADVKTANFLVSSDGVKVVLIDFGYCHAVPEGQEFTGEGNPSVGTPTHYSPEMATSSGHNWGTDVWSAMCALIHMLSGEHPWIKDYPHAGMLNYVIWSQSPPLKYIPDDVSNSVRNLVTQGLIVDKCDRPGAEELLQHEAFKYNPYLGLGDDNFSEAGEESLRSMDNNPQPSAAETAAAIGRFSSNQNLPGSHALHFEQLDRPMRRTSSAKVRRPKRVENPHPLTLSTTFEDSRAQSLPALGTENVIPDFDCLFGNLDHMSPLNESPVRPSHSRSPYPEGHSRHPLEFAGATSANESPARSSQPRSPYTGGSRHPLNITDGASNYSQANEATSSGGSSKFNNVAVGDEEGRERRLSSTSSVGSERRGRLKSGGDNERLSVEEKQEKQLNRFANELEGQLLRHISIGEEVDPILSDEDNENS